jgi:hypothetical protein
MIATTRNDESKTLVGMLKEYKLIKRPLNNQWHCVGMFGKQEPLQEVELQIIEDADKVDAKDKVCQLSTLTYHLRSPGSTSIIDDFVQQAYDWYLAELSKLEDNHAICTSFRRSSLRTKEGLPAIKGINLATRRRSNLFSFNKKKAC